MAPDGDHQERQWLLMAHLPEGTMAPDGSHIEDNGS